MFLTIDKRLIISREKDEASAKVLVGAEVLVGADVLVRTKVLVGAAGFFGADFGAVGCLDTMKGFSATAEIEGWLRSTHTKGGDNSPGISKSFSMAGQTGIKCNPSGPYLSSAEKLR